MQSLLCLTVGRSRLSLDALTFKTAQFRVLIGRLLRTAGIFLASIGLCTFATLCAADVPPPPLWGMGEYFLSATPNEACLYYFNAARNLNPSIDSYKLLDTSSPTEKVCQVWIGPHFQGNGLLKISCWFNGSVAGVKSGNPYSYYSNPRIGVVGSDLSCICPPATPLYDSTYGVCAEALVNLVISLTGPIEIRPVGVSGSSEIAFTAKVAEGSNPKSGIAVSFSVEVTANSGGHDHHDVNRPKGMLSATQGITNANGEVQFKFTAPEIAGIHTIKATCSTCSNSPVAKEIQVKVPDLLPISPNPPQKKDGTFVYALTSVDKAHQGNGRYHLNQYYLTEQSRKNLRAMIQAFSDEGWGTVALNDASLYWGGSYDITSNWGAPHKAHRDGREIDISFARAQNPVSISKQNDFYDKFCKSKKVHIPFSILHHYVRVPHFHVFLEKQQACFKSEH